MRRSALFRFATLWGALSLALGPDLVLGATLILKDGRELRGRPAPLQSLKNPEGDLPPGVVGPILLVDDDLRRCFIARREIQSVNEQQVPLERFVIKQPVPENGFRVGTVGEILRITSWDKWGRRILTMDFPGGKREDFVQGISEITPVWVKVESLNRFLWDQRIATSSIPRSELSAILRNYTDATRIEDRLKVVRLYIQAERFSDAKAELQQVVEDFPDEKPELGRVLVDLQQYEARRLLAEVQVRVDSGQHQLAFAMLEQFPTDNIAAETLQDIRERLEAYHTLLKQHSEVVERLKAHTAAIDNAELRARVQALLDELIPAINIYNFGRLSTYRRLWDDPELRVEEKLSLAITGWLLGADGAERNLSVALSLFELRELVHRYFNTERKLDREPLLDRIRGKEGADPERMARLLENMPPPFDTPAQETPGFFELRVPGLETGEEFTYYVQLPPEYNPYRRYPAVVTLHSSGVTPEKQIAWWAGDRDENGTTRGQAARHGYIVIAPAWTDPYQRSYEFEAREHAIVLHALRDACRRFAIDTDRVFLSGHSTGGMAAWDIGLAHPDLWAGVIPIVAFADKYIKHYWENGRLLPMYFIGGEMDNAQLQVNGEQFEKYLLKPGYRCTIVEFKGRGHEHFSDEIQHLFSWMGRYKRDFFPKEFTVKSLRPWDSDFWWIETSSPPPKTVVLPPDIKSTKNITPLKISGKKAEGANTLTVATGAGEVSLWLSPELVDFKQKISIRVNGTAVKGSGLYEPDVGLMLEDVRTRGDRQHPFWAKVTVKSGGK